MPQDDVGGQAQALIDAGIALANIPDRLAEAYARWDEALNLLRRAITAGDIAGCGPLFVTWAHWPICETLRDVAEPLFSKAAGISGEAAGYAKQVGDVGGQAQSLVDEGVALWNIPTRRAEGVARWDEALELTRRAMAGGHLAVFGPLFVKWAHWPICESLVADGQAAKAAAIAEEAAGYAALLAAGDGGGTHDGIPVGSGPSGTHDGTGIGGGEGTDGSLGYPHPAATGPPGPTGPAGPAGTQGPTGPQGPPGPPGAQGPQGPAGTPGSAGPAGRPGPPVPSGTPGAAGTPDSTPPPTSDHSGGPVSQLPNSSRAFLKATYDRVGLPVGVGTDAPAGAARQEPTAFDKLAFARDIALSLAEVQQLTERAGTDPNADTERLRRVSDLIEVAGSGPAAAPRAVAMAATVPAADLIDVARRAIDLRRESTVEPVGDLEAQVDRFIERRRIEPVAWLHLERIEMVPVGVERGELVATVPMAPGERVFVSRKEWATKSSEFQDIVVDELETYSEQGVAEKSDAAMSNESETKRDSSTNFGVSASGTYGPVTLTTSLDLKAAASERNARSASVKQTVEQTRKSSARVRKEHKVSMRVETRSGTEDIAAKEIHNDSGRPIRIDYYRMMRKWRVDLIRYGLRMTYDLVVPDPGASLRSTYALVELLRSKLGPFTFEVKHADINVANYLDLASVVHHGEQGQRRPRVLERLPLMLP